MIYHGVKQNGSGVIYRLGLALFDLNNPEHCLKHSDEWAFSLEAPYELHGDVDKVVIPCGYTLAPDGDTLRIYHGNREHSGNASGLLDKSCNELKIMHQLIALKPSLKSRPRNHWHVSNLLQNLANKPLVWLDKWW
jgi:predicted GH43/DUF377 family glycosyl hydrolase